MKWVAVILAGIAVALGVFAWWGTQTPSGRAKYDEMDGLYPMGAGVIAVLVLMVAIVLWLIGRKG